ncbi:unnamed protein product [Mytilus edulis]|uniref:Uncharacterized protein n=1 Tax=Mytilus edulis TaxID=6550 RepID=A0A8S3PU54_MYTED|nr:unnamed protein product [Mytilus edulis]
MATEKTFRVSSVEYDKPTKSNNIDWANCILCQEIIDEKLICPFDSKRLNVGAGYQSLADNIKKFHALRLMPEGINVCIENLDEGSGIAQSFIDHKACWHKSCNLKLNRTKLNRAEKRTSRESIDIPLVEGELSIDMSSFPAALKNRGIQMAETFCRKFKCYIMLQSCQMGINYQQCLPFYLCFMSKQNLLQ